MEFLGTKGKWKYYKTTDGFYTVATEKGNGLFVSSFHSNWSEREANALLISKAPEMLEMLKEFIRMHSEYDMRPEDELWEYADKVNELIKEATEI